MTKQWDVFLSHNSQDKALVEALARRLLGAGVRPWLDKWELIPGKNWLHAIEFALRECPVVAVCIGPSGFGKIQDPEVQVALTVAFENPELRVPPVFLRGAPKDVELPLFLRQKTWIDYRDESDESFAKLLSAIRYQDANVSHRHQPETQVCPYRGLEPFLPEHNRFFFGREDEIEELLVVLRGDHRLVVVVGASGSGKSSLVLGGLIPAIRGGQVQGSYKWRIATMRPYSEPNRWLAKALLEARQGDTDYDGWALRKLRDLLDTDDKGLLDHCTAILQHGERLLLVVDQFEELFTMTGEGRTRTAFIEALTQAVEPPGSQVHVVLTVRADFLGHALGEVRLAPFIKRSLHIALPVMSPEKLTSTIVGPATLVGLRIDDSIVDVLVNAVSNRPSSLPLLQFALTELWNHRQGGRVDYRVYKSIGGLEAAVTRQAEDTFNQLESEQQERARRVFMRLVKPGKGTDDTRRRAAWSEMDSIGESRDTGVLGAFISARLLTADGEGVEVCHDALIQHWERLRRWIEELREALRELHELQLAVALWRSADQGTEALLRGSRLQRALELRAADRLTLSAEEAAFLTASKEHEDEERRLMEEQRNRELETAQQLAQAMSSELQQRKRAQRNLGVLAAVFFAVAAVSGWYLAPILLTPRPNLQWITIADGSYQMGRDDATIQEKAAHSVPVETFEIARYEVTNEDYALCVRARHCAAPNSNRLNSLDYAKHPVVGVNWFEAQDYCNWIEGRLPTEAEWEKAATWDAKKGDKWLATSGNTFENGPGSTTEVGSYPDGRSPYGLDDMAGNVWEWTSSRLAPFPYEHDDGRENPRTEGERVVRGGSFMNMNRVATGTNRLGVAPIERSQDIGFRCVHSKESREK